MLNRKPPRHTPTPRNRRLQPKTAFPRFPSVHKANLEGQQRVDLPLSPRLNEWPLFAQSGRRPEAVAGGSPIARVDRQIE